MGLGWTNLEGIEGSVLEQDEYKMGKEEMKPEKKEMTCMDFGNIIIKYANESGGIDKEELILAGKLLGRGHPKVFAEFLDSMDTAPREMVFQILKDHKNST